MISAALLGLLLFGLGFLPLLGGPRYEAALLAGVILPSWVGIAAAWRVHGRIASTFDLVKGDGVSRQLSLLTLLGDALSVAAAHCLAVLVVALLHGLLGGMCEPQDGFLLLLLGPCFGALLAATWAATVACAWALVRIRRGILSAIPLALGAFSAPLVSALLELAGFYNSPTVYAYDPFAGYFSGPLYDTVIYDLTRLLTFRVGTFCTMVWVAIWASLLSMKFTRQSPARLMRRRGDPVFESRKVLLFALGLTFGLGSVWHSGSSEALGLSGSTASIQVALGRETKVGPCYVHFSRAVAAAEARDIAQQCVGHLGQLGNYFDLEPPQRVDIYLFANSAEKRFLMGAERTLIAKPWRREIYIQPQGFPHPVLGHELAHVVTAAFGQGPLRVAGPLGAIIPDPGRVEGFAEAASPRENSEGTLREWTAAMKQLGLLPPLEQLFRLGFWGNSAARSYSAAGSFVDYIHAQHGPEALKRWYSGEALPDIVELEWAELEAAWHAYLDATEVPADVLEIAKPRFSRPGVFERRCPHAVDRKIGEAQASCGVQEARARRLTGEAIALDPARADMELMLPTCTFAAGRAQESREEMTKLLEDESRYDVAPRRGAFEFLGNIQWLDGQWKAAASEYEKAQKLAFDRDVKRNLEFKQWALSQVAEVRRAVRVLLVPRISGDPDPRIALAGWFYTGPEKDMAAYLLARQAMVGGRTDEARQFYKTIDSKKLPLESVRRESGRMGVLLACRAVMAGENPELAEQALQAYRELKLSPAEELEASRVVERCTAPGVRQGSAG